MKEEEFQELISKYLAGHASQMERRLLEEYYDRLSAKTTIPLPVADEEKLRRDILEEVFKKAAIPTGGVIPMRQGRLRRIKYAVAAVAVLLFPLGSYYFLNNQKPQNQIALASGPAKIDIAPGGNKAVLTLANGSKIILDNTRSGILTRQGNADVSKLDSGKLAYTASNGAPTEILYNTLATPRGGQYQLELPDGTKVWLNSASSITYPTAFSGKQRLVMVTGEVYFEVVHNANMPFAVKVSNEVITDLGTSFNINAYPDEVAVTTTLVQGSVKIFLGSKTNTLAPGQQEITSREGESVTIKNGVDLDKVMAWRSGIFEFNNLDFKSIMRQVSRWYDVDVEYNTEPGTASFGGGISKQLSLQQVLHLLEGSGLHLTLDHKTIIVNK